VGGSFELVEGDLILDELELVVIFIGKLKDVNLEY
jgi:hypothetical protein